MGRWVKLGVYTQFWQTMWNRWNTLKLSHLCLWLLTSPLFGWNCQSHQEYLMLLYRYPMKSDLSSVTLSSRFMFKVVKLQQLSVMRCFAIYFRWPQSNIQWICTQPANLKIVHDNWEFQPSFCTTTVWHWVGDVSGTSVDLLYWILNSWFMI